MRQAKTVKTANATVSKAYLDALLQKLIASPPIRTDDLKPKRKKTREKKRSSA